MTDYLKKVFPNHIGCIQSLLHHDPTFRELCADYEEMCVWLADHCPPNGIRSTNECDNAREVIQDLEGEINAVLKNAHK